MTDTGWGAVQDWVPSCSWIERDGTECGREAMSLVRMHDQMSKDPNAFEWAYLCMECSAELIRTFKHGNGFTRCGTCGRRFPTINDFITEVQGLAPPVGGAR